MFQLVSIERRVDDPAGPTRFNLRVAAAGGGRDPRPVLATARERLSLERQDRTSIAERATAALTFGASAAAAREAALSTVVARPLPAAELRAAALAQVDRDLKKQGLLDDNGQVSEAAQKRFGWQREITCRPRPPRAWPLDDCNVCEPALEREIALEPAQGVGERAAQGTIALLDKSHEFRCCPTARPKRHHSCRGAAGDSVRNTFRGIAPGAMSANIVRSEVIGDERDIPTASLATMVDDRRRAGTHCADAAAAGLAAEAQPPPKNARTTRRPIARGW